MNEQNGPQPIGVIGGSGLYSFLRDADFVDVETPYGPPSAAVAVGEVAGRAVAFLPRHGRSHEYPPHRVPYRANVWALRSLGVRQVLAPCAVGGLGTTVAPGELVVPDQLVDRTSARASTFVETGAIHAPFADPFCPVLRASLTAGAMTPTDGGTMVIVEGPRFSSRAESQWYAAQGWSLINMTGLPEASLAREARLCYASLALVTDMDAGQDRGEGVGQADVFAMFEQSIGKVKEHLVSVIADLPAVGGCECSSWADELTLTYELP